jgi:anaphase-promoting complex subunit 5
MSRYLSPSKVALLCLTSLYTEGAVPNSSATVVLSFLISHILPLGSSQSSSESFKIDRNHAIAIQEFEDALSTHASSIPGRSIWDIFLKKIWFLDCCDALEVFSVNIPSLLVKTREEQIRDRDNGIAPQAGKILLSRCSPLGAFVRRAQLEFTRLQFHDSVRLWKAFIKYRLPTYRAWARKNPSDSQAAVDMNLIGLGLDSNSYLARVVYGDIEHDREYEHGISTKDVERLLEFQVGELQSKDLLA